MCSSFERNGLQFPNVFLFEMPETASFPNLFFRLSKRFHNFAAKESFYYSSRNLLNCKIYD